MSTMSEPSLLDQIDLVTNAYRSALGVPISVHRPCRAYSRPSQAPGIHLHLFALPRRLPWLALPGEPDMTPMPTAFGHVLRESARLGLALPARLGRGTALRDEEGRALAYLDQRNIFVLFDLLGQHAALALLLLRQLLDRSLELMVPDVAAQSGVHPERVREILAALRRATGLQESRWREQQAALARRQFLEARSEQLEEEIRFLEQEIRSSEEALEAASLRLTAETRHLQACRRRLRALKGEGGHEELDAARELEHLSSLPEILEVSTWPEGLRVITRPITVEHAGKLHALGTFQIELSYSGKVSIRNLTSRHGYYDHPHIWDGHPCLGNIREGLAKLIGELQLAAAAELLLDFLKTINPKDWYISIEHWREVPAKGWPSALDRSPHKPPRKG
jgi:hypothetical protein